MSQKTTARGTGARGTTTAFAALGVMVMALGGVAACSSGAATAGSTASGTPTGQVSTTPSPMPLPSSPPVATNPSGGALPTGGSTTAAPPAGTPKQVNVKANGYSTTGTSLSVYFFAGVCQKFGLKADQSTQGQVRVTVVVTQWPKPGQMCPALIQQQVVSTDLGSPLNGRSVVDTVSGKALPLENPMPGGARVTHGPIKSG